MTQEELIKQAYAYGVTVALQESGVEKTAADQYAVKMAENPQILAAIMKALKGAGGKIQGAAGQVAGGAKDLAGRAAGGIQQGYGKARDAVQDKMIGAFSPMQARMSNMPQTNAIGALPRAIEQNPYAALGIGAGAGAGLGAGAGYALGNDEG